MAKKKVTKKKGLAPKRAKFVQEYLIDLNATQAALRAGYSEKTAASQGQRLLKDEKVAVAIQEAMDKRQKRTEITQDSVLANLAEISDRCMQAVPVKDRTGKMMFVETPEGLMCPAFTFNAQGAIKSNELIGKHLKMFSEKIEHDVKGNLTINIKKYSAGE